MPSQVTRLPRITVAVPCRDAERWIRTALASLLGQGYPDLEVVVQDGASRDGTVDVLRAHADRISWTSEPDAGQADALNRAFARATGEVLGWLNADDLLLPGSLERIGRAFLDPSVEAVCGWSVVVDEEGRPVGTQVYPAPTREVLRLRPRLPQETVYWRRGVRDRLGPLDASLDLCFDREWWLRMAEAGVVPRLLRTFLAAYRRHPAQKGARLRERARAEEVEILRRVHGPAADPETLRRRVPWAWRARKRLLKRLARWGLLGRPALPPG